MFVGQAPPPEYTDLTLCRDVYHCTPEELDRQDSDRVQTHLALLAAENRVRGFSGGGGSKLGKTPRKKEAVGASKPSGDPDNKHQRGRPGSKATVDGTGSDIPTG